jgi:uncharacterized membrane protein YeaQ/YmgE (transglycosylase-associated protein family)
MLTFLLLLALGGFIVGGLARFALPGPDPMPWYATIGLGIAGMVVGGLVGRLLFNSTGGFLLALLGAVLLLYAYRRFVQGRGLSGPAREPL